MIIWQGYGLLAVIIPLICHCIFYKLFPNGPDLTGLANIVSGVILYKFGKYLHNPKTNETILYDESGTPYKFIKHIDTLFFIEIEYVGIIFVAVGIIMFINT